MGRRISKEFLHPSILEGVDNKIGNLDSLETDAKGNMVQAINELADKIDTEIAEGKELIANAVGEPLTAEESFDEMSNDINSLLSTFKTNMMNNGITVESSDRFKSLIDKIATMVEEGEGKGIQFASGITSNNFSNVQIDGVDFTCLNISLNFKPTILIVRNHGNYGFYIEDFYPDNFNIVTVDNGYDEYRNVKNYEIDKGNNNYSIPIGYTIQEDTTYYWAVGVGEEDTTLRDSLADILEGKGVDVTEEDDMASLITKVDNLQSLNIITAQELPETVVDNQIVLITDTKPSAVNIKPTDLCGPTIDTVVDIGYNSSSRKATLTTNNNNITLSLYLYNAVQNKSGVNNTIYGFIGNNDGWNLFSPTLPDLYKEGGDTCDIMTGGWYTKAENDNGVYYTEKATVLDTGCLYMETYGSKFTYTNKPIDVTDYKKIYFDYHIESVSGAYWIGLVDNNTNMHDVQDAKKVIKQTSDVGDISRTTKSIDISDITGEWYIAFDGYPWNGYQHRMYIYNVWMEM